MTQGPTPAIGKYRVIAKLGSGGMANVYLAVMRGRSGFSKVVVLKVPHDTVYEDPMLLSMFVDEARLLARLNHRNTVQTFELVRDSGRDVIVMEYLDGQTLHEIITRCQSENVALPLGLHLRIVLEALSGLHYAHELRDYDGASMGLVHRDVSPHNISVTFDGQVKMLDFGIAKAATSSHVTQQGTFKGKVRYMAPEQLTGGVIDRRADIFSVGVVLWEAATGRTLWKDTTANDVIASVIGNRIPMPLDVTPTADARLDAIVRRALAFDRDERYSTCLELQADLEALMTAMTPRHSSEDVAQFVSGLFADARTERQRLIREQVSRANVEAWDEDHAASANELLSGSASMTPLAPAHHSERPGAGSTSIMHSIPPSIPPRLDTGTRDDGPDGAIRATSQRPAAQAASYPRYLIVAAAFLLVTLLVAAATVGILRVVTVTSNAGASAPSSTSSPRAPNERATPGAKASITFSAKPREAKLFLDDEPLPSNPFTKKVLKDGSFHSLRAEADAHVSKTLGVHFDDDKELVVTLDAKEPAIIGPWALPAVAPPPVTSKGQQSVPKTISSAAPAPVAAPTAAPSTPATPKRPERHIDEQL